MLTIPEVLALGSGHVRKGGTVPAAAAPLLTAAGKHLGSLRLSLGKFEKGTSLYYFCNFSLSPKLFQNKVKISF